MPDPEIFVESHPKRPLSHRIAAYRRLWWLGLVTFAFDRLTKIWVVGALPYNPYHDHLPEFQREIIPGFLYFIHIGNTGAAWSFMAGHGTLLALLALGTLFALYYWRHAVGLSKPATQIAFGLACGGIVGNLYDRLRHGHVIDFIDLHFGSYIYPTFNIADSGICIGVILYLWLTWKEPGTSTSS